MSYDLEEMLFLLLSLKHTNSSSFVTEHLSFSGVGALCSEAIREGFIIETRKELKITDKGLAFISETNKRSGGRPGTIRRKHCAKKPAKKG